MSYTIEKVCTAIDETGIFQRIEAEHPGGVTIPSDARDPLDHDSYVIPRATPMTPIHTEDIGTHNLGEWMPVRRSLVLTVTGATSCTVVDHNSFHVTDVIHMIPIAGPLGTIVNLGAITAINRTTGVITWTNASNAVSPGQWIEVRENSCIDPANTTGYLVPYPFGMLRNPYSSVVQFSDDTGIEVAPIFASIVIDGAIREADINFPDDASDDMLLMAQSMVWNVGGTLQIILPNKGERVIVPGLSA